MNLKVFIQGFYDPLANKMINDSARIYLRNVSPPYALVDSALGVLDANGIGNLAFQNAVNSVPYFIVIRHRNSLETWSAVGYSFTAGQLNYDFTTSASQAFGNNMKEVDSSPVRFGIFSADVTQDGLVNVNDIILIYNNASSFANGYVVTDVTGDNVTNLTDILVAYDNSNSFVSVKRP